MIDENKKLLDEVIKNRLNTAMSSDAEAAKRDAAFEQAMKAIDRQIELSKLDASSDEQVNKQTTAKKEAYVNWAIRVAEVVLGLVAMPVIKHRMGRRDMRDLCMFEKDYTFTTSAGKSCAKSRFKFW